MLVAVKTTDFEPIQAFVVLEDARVMPSAFQSLHPVNPFSKLWLLNRLLMGCVTSLEDVTLLFLLDVPEFEVYCTFTAPLSSIALVVLPY